MKTKLLFQTLFIGLLFVLTSCSKHRATTSLEEKQLKGNVRRSMERYYSTTSKFGETLKGPITHSNEYEFNEQGNLIKFTQYNKDGGIELKEVSKYNDEGLIVELKAYHSVGTLDYRVIFNYKKGRIFEKVKYNDHGNIERKDEYDEQGRGIAFYYFDNEGFLSERHENVYDSEGTLIKTLVFDSNNNLIKSKPAQSYVLGGGALFEFFEELDEQGNWLRAYNSHTMCEREIEYY